MTWSPAQAVAIARQWVGFHEGPANKNPFSLWQYGNSYNPWCDSFVCYCAFQAGYRFPSYSGSGIKGDYNVGSHHYHAVRQGIWRTAAYRAAPGDLVVLNFNQQDQHIEMVIGDAGGNVATIGGNTGDSVLYRTRYRGNVGGFIALTQDHQQAPDRPVQPKEIRAMGMTAGCPIPGSHAQAKAPWKGRYPEIQAVLQANGTTDLVGGNGCEIVGALSYLGMSILHLGKLNKPIRVIQPVWVTSATGAVKYSGKMVGIAEDHGTFTVATKLHYL